MEKLYFTDRVMDFQLDDESILLINTISSAFDIIDSDTYERIEEMKKGYSNFDDKDELMQTLIKRGYVFEQKEKEQEFIRKYAEIHQKYIEKNLVRSFTICPTMGCNLRCTYCFEGDENLSNKKVMTEEQRLTHQKHRFPCLEESPCYLKTCQLYKRHLILQKQGTSK